MKLRCLGSGSSGNCYLLENETECIVIEQGMPFALAKILLDFNINKIVGAVQSHSHKDHAKYSKEYEKCGIPVFKPAETEKRTVTYGGFRIQAFPLVHDVPCFGFVFWHDEMEPLVFATDTEYVPVKFKSLRPSTLMIECNYQEKYLPEGRKADRQYGTHMEEQTTIRCVEANKTDALKTVILIHLSDGSCDPKEVMESVSAVAGEGVAVYTAKEGMVVNL